MVRASALRIRSLAPFASVAGTFSVGVNRAAIRAIAPSFGVELTPVEYHDAGGISVVSWPSLADRTMALIVTRAVATVQRDLRSAVFLQI
jgi:hypothetical protein